MSSRLRTFGRRALAVGACCAACCWTASLRAQSFDYRPKPRAGGSEQAFGDPTPAPGYMRPAEAINPPDANGSPSYAQLARDPSLGPMGILPPFSANGRPMHGGFSIATNNDRLPPGDSEVKLAQYSTGIEPLPPTNYGGMEVMPSPTAPGQYPGLSALGPDGQPIADDPYCRPQQVGDITGIEKWFQTTWLGNPTLWQNFNELSGVQGFKGPVDQGLNGNFGFHKGVNWAIPAWKQAGIGFQAGGVIAVSDLSGSSGPVNSTREQYFVTSGLFRRGTRNSGWQGGAVIDYLHDNFYIKMDLLQVRSEVSYIYHCHELGFWSAVHLRSDKQAAPAFFTQQPTVTWQSNDQFNFFYRYTFCNGGVGRTWGGLSGVGDIIFGSDALAPLSERWALQLVTNYLIPRSDPTLPNAVKESWGVTMSLIWYPGYRVPNACFNPYRPLFVVADNGTLFVRQK